MCLDTYAQTLDDAIRYSVLQRVGTARGLGVGGAMGSIGGDFGSLASNPAGIAMYKWSEFQISPGLNRSESNSTLTASAGNSLSDDRTRFVFPSASYVQVNRVLDKHWTRTVFGIGINRIADFNKKFQYQGNQANSITQYFIEQSNFINPDNLEQLSPFVGLPAYDAFITTFDTYTSQYVADIDRNQVVDKTQTISQKGGIDELTFAFGADFDNKLHLGVSLSLPFLSFKEKKEYTETLTGHPVFNTLEFDENLTANGGGVNIKVGGKYIIARKVHISAAFHSPTWMRINEEFDNRANYQYIFNEDLFPSPGPQEGLSPEGAFEYDLRTPWRTTGGLGIIIGRIGFVSSEVEYVNYKSAKFKISDDPGFEEQLNDDIFFELGSTLAVRFGAEIRPTKAIRIRGGYGMGESVFADTEGLEGQYFSLGAGIWLGDQIFIDAAFRSEMIDQRYNPYSLRQGASPLVNTAYDQNTMVLTLGVRM